MGILQPIITIVLFFLILGTLVVLRLARRRRERFLRARLPQDGRAARPA